MVLMIVGLGVDVVDIARIKKAWDRHKTFPLKILNDQEYHIFDTLPYTRQLEFLAGRFAVKEACAKALGTGIGKRLHFHDMTVLPMTNGAPKLTCQHFDGHIHVSISHTDTIVMAQVILEQ